MSARGKRRSTSFERRHYTCTKLWYWLLHLSAYSAVINPESNFLNAASRWHDLTRTAEKRNMFSCRWPLCLRSRVVPNCSQLEKKELLRATCCWTDSEVHPCEYRPQTADGGLKTIAPHSNSSCSQLWSILMCVSEYIYTFVHAHAYRTPFPPTKDRLPHAVTHPIEAKTFTCRAEGQSTLSEWRCLQFGLSPKQLSSDRCRPALQTPSSLSHCFWTCKMASDGG